MNKKISDNTRKEKDSLGIVEVPANHYWGAQTQRSLQNFSIGNEIIPKEVITALALIKKSAAKVNSDFGKIDSDIALAIIEAADEILNDHHINEFPLSVWQTGSGTQTNMNMNEVLANRACEIMGGRKGDKSLVHPNDHVNCSQSSNDTFPTAMHVASVIIIDAQLLPALALLQKTLDQKSQDWAKITKIGRTHLQDATPITLGQEFSSFAYQIHNSIQRIHEVLPRLHQLAQGGTAVGTGLNSPKGFDVAFCKEISKLSGKNFKSSPNKFEAIATHDSIVESSGVLNTLAVSLMKIANDIRLLASGPRAGLGELILPENEPGSSIMPGKVNPTQTESLCQVCAQVIGNHASITIAGASGNLQLNVYKPMIIYNFIQTIRILSDAIKSFTNNCVYGIEPNEVNINNSTKKSLMLVTALTPHIGYDNAAKIAKKAHDEGITLKESALKLGTVSEVDFDYWIDPNKMIEPS